MDRVLVPQALEGTRGCSAAFWQPQARPTPARPLPSPCAAPDPVPPPVHCPRDLTDNQLTTLPLAGLGGLKHLKLKGNPALSQAFSKDSFPKLR